MAGFHVEGFFVCHTVRGSYLTLLDPADVLERGLPGLPGEIFFGELIGSLGDDTTHLRPEWVRENPRFVELLHRVVERWAPEGPDFQFEAWRQRDGWVYVLDARTPTPQESVPAEDIIGAFEVQGGDLVVGSYHAFESRRLVGANDVFSLGPELHDCLMWELERLVES